MIRADEIREGNGQIHFALTVLEAVPLRLKADPPDWNSFAISSEIDLASSPAVVGCVSALQTFARLVWAFLELWLVEPATTEIRSELS